MSLFDRMQARCPICDAAQEIDLVGSVNADRRPDLRAQILDRRFQEQTCATCGAVFRLPPGFTYGDFGRHQWILAHPFELRGEWRRLEVEALETFAALYGEGSTAEAREIGQGIAPRITFGWPAVRETLVCQEAGLDDIELELAKLAVLRRVPGSPVADGTELRLDRIEGEVLVLYWVDAVTESAITAVRLPRAAYDAIAADGVAWADLRRQIGAGPFADYARILFG